MKVGSTNLTGQFLDERRGIRSLSIYLRPAKLTTPLYTPYYYRRRAPPWPTTSAPPPVDPAASPLFSEAARLMRRCVLISNTPTLAVVEGTYLPEPGQLTPKVVVLHRPEWLGEDIGELLVRAYVPEFYLLSLDLFPQPVVLHIKVLRSLR